MDEAPTTPKSPTETKADEHPVVKRKSFGKPLWTLILVLIVLGGAAYVLVPMWNPAAPPPEETKATAFPAAVKQQFALPPEAAPISALDGAGIASATFSLPKTRTPVEWLEQIATASHFARSKPRGANSSLLDTKDRVMRTIRYDKLKERYHVRSEPYTLAGGAAGR